MSQNNLVSDAACQKFISALKEDKDRTTDLVFDDMQKSKAFVMAQIPDGGVVDYNDNNDTIEYTAAMQAHRQYRDIDANPRDLISGQMEGRDENGRTGLFDTQVNEIDPNACSGTCRFRFGQGFKTYTTRDYELPMSTDVVCARDYIRKGRAHVDGYFRGLTKSFRDYGKDNYEANLMNLVIANGGANASVLGANEFRVTSGGFVAPPKNRMSIHFLRQYRQYMVRENALDELGYLEIYMPREDWFDAVTEDQVQRNLMGNTASFNTHTFDDKRGNLMGKQFGVYDGIRCVFEEMPVRGYYKPTGESGGETFSDFVRVYHWKNEVNEDGGLSAEANHSYDDPFIVVDGIRYDMVTLAFVINKKSFTRFGLGAAKKYRGEKPMGQNFDMSVRDGAYLDCNDFNDKFKIVTRHAFRFKVEKAELSGAIAYRHSRPEGYIIAPTGVDQTAPDPAFASPEVYEKCEAGTCDKANCACEGLEADDNGDCVAAGSKSQVNLEPAVAATVLFLGDTIPVEIEVARIGNTNGTGTVDYAFADGTAANGVDFNGVGGTITFLEGESGSIAIPLEVIAATGATQDFTITLSNATGDLELGSSVVTTITIEDGQ